MSDRSFYEKKLYPLQDEVMAVVEKEGKIFYLTGGTALHRFYNGCRYSDDLDFFTLHGIKDFRVRLRSIMDAFSVRNLSYQVDSISDDFSRLTILKNSIQLKVDFVNDSVFRYGNVKKFPLFSRVDNEINIVANKIGAISRYEIKDIVDIWFISHKRRFNWEDIIEITSKKTPVDPVDVSRIIKEMPKKELRFVKWSRSIDMAHIYRDLQIIIKDIIKGNRNSLHN